MEAVTGQQRLNVKNVLLLVIMPENAPGIHFFMRILVKSVKKGELHFIILVTCVGSQIHATGLLIGKPALPLSGKRTL